MTYKLNILIWGKKINRMMKNHKKIFSLNETNNCTLMIWNFWAFICDENERLYDKSMFQRLMEFRFLWLTSVGINKKEVDKQWKPVFMIKSIALDLNITWWHHKHQIPDFQRISFWIYPLLHFHKSSSKANSSTTKPSSYKGKFLFIFLCQFSNVL